MSGRAPRPLVAGNWKMNGGRGSAELARAVAAGWGGERPADLLVCPPATMVAGVADILKGGPVAVGGQDCHPAASGAHTGDVSAEMLAEAGATAVIVGHSERRTDHGETNATVRAKAEAAARAGLIPIVCVGETREEREAGRALAVVTGQLEGSIPPAVDRLVVAYEPVWAIGTGLVPTAADVGTMHAAIRETLARILGAERAGDVRILYGGSVKPSNARELMGVPDVDGALVGGASLVAADFLAIAAACGMR